jgi:hypothetical protein
MNGASALVALAIDPPASIRGPDVGYPGEIEQQIGMAIAAAVEVIGQGLVDYEAQGHTRDTTRAAAGKRLGEVCMLQLSAPLVALSVVGGKPVVAIMMEG